MPIPIVCSCGFRTQVKDHLAGYKTQCLKCRTVLRVPGTKIPTAIPYEEPEGEPEPLVLEPIVEEEPLVLEPVEDEIRLID